MPTTVELDGPVCVKPCRKGLQGAELRHSPLQGDHGCNVPSLLSRGILIQSSIQVGHISGMVLAMVQLHDGTAHIRLQLTWSVWKVRQREPGSR